MKKVLLFISMLLAAVLITSLYSCTQDGGDNDNRHRQGETEVDSISAACQIFRQVTSKVNVYYDQCKSMKELGTFLQDILAIDNVEEAYFVDNHLFITIKGYGTMAYAYFDKDDEGLGNQLNSQNYEIQTRAVAARTYINPDYALLNAVVSNQQYEDRMWTRQVSDYAVKILNDAGINATPNISPDIDFFENQIFNYDIIFHIGHGCYNDKKKVHWFVTSQEITTNEELISLKSRYRDDQVIVCNIEGRYFAYISERLYDSSANRFKTSGKAIFLAVPCQALMGGEISSWVDPNEQDFSFAETLKDLGLGFFMGYDESNGWGQMAGLVYLGKLVSGMTVSNSYTTLPYEYIHEERSEKHHWFFEREWTADLFPDYSDTNPNIANSTLTRPVMEDIGDEDIKEDHSLELKASAILYDDFLFNDVYGVTQEYLRVFKYAAFYYGFELSESQDFKNATPLSKMPVGTDDSSKKEKCSHSNNKVNFSQIISTNNLKSETKYYIRAYLYDGHDYNYSDYDTFTTPKQERIDQVIPEDIREQMEPFIPIYDGNNPPTIEGVFVIDSPEVVHDTTNNYKKGDTGFTPIYLRFLNQDFMNNTLDYEERDVYNGKVVGESSGPGAFISGEGNNFSVFFSTTGVNHYDKYDISIKTSLVISGTKTDSGIQDVRYAFVLTDKGADPDHHIMDKGGFRVFKDSDDFASKATWPSGARSWGWDYHVKDGKITTPWSIYAVRK